MASDDDTIYIDVVPKLDEGAADEIEGKLKGKLSHAADSLKDSLSTAFDSIGDRLGGAGGFGEKLHDTLAGAFSGKEWDDLSKRAGGALGGGIHDAIGDVLHGDFGNILGDFGKVGDVLGGAVDKLSSRLDGLGKAGGAIGNVLSGSGSGNDLNDIIGGAKDLGFKIPGPIGNLQHVNDAINKMNEHPGQTEDWLSQHIPGIGTAENLIEKGPQDVGNWFAEHTWASSSPTRDAASDKWSSSVASEVSIEASAATISAGSVSLGGSISLPGLSTGNSLAGSSGSGRTTSSGIAAAGGDSGSMASLYSGGGGTTIAKGHYDTGGIIPGDSPGHDNMIGILPGGSAVGLEGGEGVIRPEAMGRPGVADLISSLNQHYDGGTDTNSPSVSVPPTQGSSSSPQQQQLGSGSGGGVSGGLIGAAEQAGVAAAGVAGFGGGAIAAQIAEQETNLAIQKSSQIASALIAAPFETFGLSGGQMGAPSVNPMGGWIGKVVGGFLGGQTSLPNMAASAGGVQPPKQPNQQKQPGQDDPGNGGQSSGPKGSADDPMHVKSVNGETPTMAQGGATSAANLTASMSAGIGAIP